MDEVVEGIEFVLGLLRAANVRMGSRGGIIIRVQAAQNAAVNQARRHNIN